MLHVPESEMKQSHHVQGKMGPDKSEVRWRLIDVLRESTAFLHRKGVENPRLQSERLMSKVLGCSRIDLYVRFEDAVKSTDRRELKSMLHRRVQHEPLQYILGETEFMSLPFKVSPEVLIPRPETEILVETIIEKMKSVGHLRVLDVGVGSGNIAVSLAVALPGAEIVGVDVDKPILALAGANALLNGVEERVQLIQADVRRTQFTQALKGKFDVIVSNPPYVSLDEWDSLPPEIREFEPRAALCDEDSGLRFFEFIAPAAFEMLEFGGKLFFEVGDSQSASVREMLKRFGYTAIEILPDLNSILRVVVGTKPVAV